MNGLDNKTRGYINKGLQVVTVDSIKPLYKYGKEAKNVELVSFKESERLFVAKKDYYKVKDKAFLIPEGCCISNNKLFKGYRELGEDKNKTYLEEVDDNSYKVVSIEFKLSPFKYLSIKSDSILSSCILISLEDMIWYLKKLRIPFYGKTLNQIATLYQKDIGVYECESADRKLFKLKGNNIFSKIYNLIVKLFRNK